MLGWKIDIKSEEEKRQEVELQMSALVGSAATPLESVTGLGEGLIEKLSAAGVTTVESLADMTPEQLEAIEGIGPKTVEKISLAVNNYFASLESGEAVAAPAEGEEIAAEGAAEESAASAEAGVEPGRVSSFRRATTIRQRRSPLLWKRMRSQKTPGRLNRPNLPEEPVPSGDEQADTEQEEKQ